MVIPAHPPGPQRGALSTEFMVAMALLVAVALPLGVSWMGDARALRASYHRAVAMEIVDGELEVLASGEWRQLLPGPQPYTVRGAAARNLPPGKFTATLAHPKIRLEWKSAKRQGIGAIAREVEVP